MFLVSFSPPAHASRRPAACRLLKDSKADLKVLRGLANAGGLAAKENRKQAKVTLLKLGDVITSTVQQVGGDKTVKSHLWYIVANIAEKKEDWLQKMYLKLAEGKAKE